MILLAQGRHILTVTIPDVRTQTFILDTTQLPTGFHIKWRKRFLEDEWQGFDTEDFGDIEFDRALIGWEIFFTLDYSNIADQDFLHTIGEFLDFISSNVATITFQPREEDESWVIPIVDMTDEIDLQLLIGDEGYSGLMLVFKAKKTYKNLDWIKQVPVTPESAGGGTVFTPIEGGM